MRQAFRSASQRRRGNADHLMEKGGGEPVAAALLSMENVEITAD